MKHEIATPFGLARTPCDVKIFNAFVLAEYFGVNPKTIYRRRWAKGIPAYQTGGVNFSGLRSETFAL
jgi:hypothetical protein